LKKKDKKNLFNLYFYEKNGFFKEKIKERVIFTLFKKSMYLPW